MSKQITVVNPEKEGDHYIQIDQPEIRHVTARKIFKRDHSLKGYRYIAHLADGSEVVIRASATRLYPNAYLYDFVVATGKRGLASVFSYGQAPAKWPAGSKGPQVIEHFVVTLEAD